MNKVGKVLLTWMEDSDDEFVWEDFKRELDALIQKKNPNGYWYAEMQDFGWMNQDGYKYFQAIDSTTLLRDILPNTDCHFKIFNFDTGIAIQNYHHDSPTGNEWYYIKPISKKTYEDNN